MRAVVGLNVALPVVGDAAVGDIGPRDAVSKVVRPEVIVRVAVEAANDVPVIELPLLEGALGKTVEDTQLEPALLVSPLAKRDGQVDFQIAILFLKIAEIAGGIRWIRQAGGAGGGRATVRLKVEKAHVRLVL